MLFVKNSVANNNLLKNTVFITVFCALLLGNSGVVHAFDLSPKNTSTRFNDEILVLPLAHDRLYAQNKERPVRPRSEVMQEVKQRYNAKVLKISLNQRRDTYNVRVLMPNGKVRSLKVSALR